jgi:GWxTD domain-containing protein
MSKYFLVIILFSLQFSFSQKNSLKVFLDQKQFNHPELGNLLEIHFQFIAYTMKFLPVEGGLQSEIALQYSLKNDKNEVINSDAYRLKSPLMRDSIIEDFYELRRFSLKPGTYTLDLSISDLNSNDKEITSIQEITIKKEEKMQSISEIVTADKIAKTIEENAFSKSGYDIIPRISNYFPTMIQMIPVYFEIYNFSEFKNTFGLKQSIKNVKTKMELEEYTRYTKIDIEKVLPMIRQIDISNLKTGEYEIEYSLIDKDNQQIAVQSFFIERFNENTDRFINPESTVLDPSFQKSITDDSLKFYLSSLIPISNPAEVKNIIKLIKSKNNELFRKYIQSYWASMSNGTSSYENWMKYKAQVLLVHRIYGNNFMMGHETDRGRVYLQYGPPNNIITREVSSAELPYEIWRYDKISIYSNRKFIFYNPDLVNNNYRLLHSDVLGEARNPRWQQILQKRGSYNTDVYNNKDGIEDSFGNKSGEFFNQY